MDPPYALNPFLTGMSLFRVKMGTVRENRGVLRGGFRKNRNKEHLKIEKTNFLTRGENRRIL